MLLGSGCFASETPLTTSSCRVLASSTAVPGLTITAESDRCVFRSGEGGRFRYAVDVTSPISFDVPASVGCGSCRPATGDPTTMISLVVGGDSVRYCECDVGCCAPEPGGRVTLAPGHYEGVLDWPGRAWDGPSDTGNPLGDPFPPGDYAFHATLGLPGLGFVDAALPIVVTSR